MSPSAVAIPSYYQPGAALSIHVDGISSPFCVEIVNPITPFTMSQTLIVKAAGGIPKALGLLEPDSPFIMKVFDPRFFSRDREVNHTPWTYTAEKAAADVRPPGVPPDPSKRPVGGDLKVWEEWYYRHAELRYRTETRAYERLAPLQGKSIPKFLGKGSLHGLPGRAIVPHFILLEFIPDAKNLATVDRHVVDESICQSLVNTGLELGKLGITHHDYTPQNILLSPGSRPTRGVIIDFGEAIVRLPEHSDEEWRQVVASSGDLPYLRIRLRKYIGYTQTEG